LLNSFCNSVTVMDCQLLLSSKIIISANSSSDSHNSFGCSDFVRTTLLCNKKYEIAYSFSNGHD
jgi:hypothetical protein